MSMLLGVLMRGGGPKLSLSGETISSTGGANTGVKIDADGNVYKIDNAGYTQIDTATDWIRPVSAAGAAYEAQLTVDSGDAPESGPAVSSWNTLDIDREWSSNTGGKSGNWRIKIRLASGGSVLAEAVYDVTVGV